MEKGDSKTPSQRSASTEDHGKTEFVEVGGDERQQKKASWIKRLNPFHTSQLPPVPLHDAGLVPEVKASFFSKLTWGWVGSLMMVSPPLFWNND
jgi:hypothetical protein